ncbi:uncharacterized protein LACBIDRAFT_294116 [Laccaria bicolor S238N-H82]|uniref:Predicted protein n=1 Tax=Laccaria bicolor (strain S238N-H82 / ATCC MYA-4686) TaxID=486041 RepID=B0D9H9_LACBS|nr:uncharacterized protein LACBIDRAFT_294116 [Laccaria bicolor S238N-H82]EDR08355.1 predicted protein [Laccaria bicolor S238N-H82]|eukprot:XP_001880580.1 predicted protein [Laccaria bicolor S238N-H82]
MSENSSTHTDPPQHPEDARVEMLDKGSICWLRECSARRRLLTRQMCHCVGTARWTLSQVMTVSGQVDTSVTVEEDDADGFAARLMRPLDLKVLQQNRARSTKVSDKPRVVVLDVDFVVGDFVVWSERVRIGWEVEWRISSV